MSNKLLYLSQANVVSAGPTMAKVTGMQEQASSPGKRQDIAEARLYDEQARLVGRAVATFIVLPNVSTTRVFGDRSIRCASPHQYEQQVIHVRSRRAGAEQVA